jgi:hypothetical protein
VKFLLSVTLRRLDLAAEIYHLKEPQKLPLVSNPPPGAAAKSVDMGDQGGMALGAWRSMRTRSTMPSWRCYA